MDAFLGFVHIAGKLNILMGQKAGYSIQCTENQQNTSAILSMSFTDQISAWHGKVPCYDSNHLQGQVAFPSCHQLILTTTVCVLNSYIFYLWKPIYAPHCPDGLKFSQISNLLQTWAYKFLFSLISWRIESQYQLPEASMHFSSNAFKCKFHARALHSVIRKVCH